jgi:hypothetical protein
MDNIGVSMKLKQMTNRNTNATDKEFEKSRMVDSILCTSVCTSGCTGSRKKEAYVYM